MIPKMVTSDRDQPGDRPICGGNVAKAPPGHLVGVRQEVLEILTDNSAVASVAGEDRVRRSEQLAEPGFRCHYMGSCLNLPQRYRHSLATPTKRERLFPGDPRPPRPSTFNLYRITRPHEALTSAA
jgi:hypothetical protein